MTAYRFGLLPLSPPRVELRPIAHLTRDLRDHHLKAKWDRLTRRWHRIWRT